MKKCGTICLVLIMLLSACSQAMEIQLKSESTTTWQEQYDLGIRYLSEGNYEEAIIAFTAAIEIDPKQAAAYVGRGDAYVASGETEEYLTAAQADYEDAIELDGSIPNAYLGLAEVYARRGQLEKALEVLQRGLEKNESNEILLNRIQELKTFLGGSNETIESGIITVLLEQRIAFCETVDPELYTSIHKFEYDTQGYLINSSYSFSHDDGNAWFESSSDTWEYNGAAQKWIHRYRRNGEDREEELSEYKPGSHNYTTAVNGQACITTDPYPESTSTVIFNPEYDNASAPTPNRKIWYSANYTYDEEGNAIYIESYNIDGILLGTCELDWAEINLSKGENTT